MRLLLGRTTFVGDGGGTAACNRKHKTIEYMDEWKVSGVVQPWCLLEVMIWQAWLVGRVKKTSLANLKGSSETHLSRVLFHRIGFNNYLDLGIGTSQCLFRFLVCCVAVLHVDVLLCRPLKANPLPTNERRLSRAELRSNVHCHWLQLSWDNRTKD